MFTVKSTELGKAFDNAYHSLWVDANTGSLHQILQIKNFWNKFYLKIHDVYYDGAGNRIWYVDFSDKEQYVLFMLERA